MFIFFYDLYCLAVYYRNPFFVLRYKKEKNMVKIDVNRDYNLYYTPDGERLDEGVCEAVDTNDYYGL